jgi:hypothetical protein
VYLVQKTKKPLSTLHTISLIVGKTDFKTAIDKTVAGEGDLLSTL